jgi:hypothetical protein
MSGPGDDRRAPPDDRDELDARPPFLTWRAIYVIVLAALGAQIALYAFLARAYG